MLSVAGRLRVVNLQTTVIDAAAWKDALSAQCTLLSLIHIYSKVIDSRPTEDGEKIRRRRECLSCKKRFTTYEIVETCLLYTSRCV